MLKGIGGSPGVVGGVAYRVESVLRTREPQELESSAMVPAEMERFDRAVADSASELEAFVAKVTQELGASAADIFQSHLQILNDPGLLSKVHQLIETRHLNALSALQMVMQDFATQ